MYSQVISSEVLEPHHPDLFKTLAAPATLTALNMINPNHFDHSNHLIILTTPVRPTMPMTTTIVINLTTCYLTIGQ